MTPRCRAPRCSVHGNPSASVCVCVCACVYVCRILKVLLVCNPEVFVSEGVLPPNQSADCVAVYVPLSLPPPFFFPFSNLLYLEFCTCFLSSSPTARVSVIACLCASIYYYFFPFYFAHSFLFSFFFFCYFYPWKLENGLVAKFPLLYAFLQDA